MAAKNFNHVHVAGLTYKQAIITDTSSIALSVNFLHMQLIYGRKTAQRFAKFKFPETISWSPNPKHFSNTEESLKLIKEIIILYIKDEREKLQLEPSQPALMILNVFSG